ncbi:hypothetical protein, variant [Allomyces macrogynus ATCC 38327]|uniref:Citrate transporter-like domain-containing protein n=1 Tax=Allomyces macrogynus (strain ATCC 38327) TaxID=578462 RepID=A0A0L0T2C6_ALLM3|nr:hypothetical protein, variant [Allomyces macrogynus ATCC 38327]|eukprot:KNE68877.1 hypothetical protein, variant [Allomyces macrogynus ATCC 38327]
MSSDAAPPPPLAPLTAASVVTILLFLLVNVFVVHPIEFRVKAAFRKAAGQPGTIPIVLNYATVTFPAALVLLATGAITPDTVRRAIVGDDKLVPWVVVVLFFSMAYICISLDLTGVLEYISLKVLQLLGKSGKRLNMAVFALTSVMTLFTSNDVVIMTLTPVILYLARHTGCNPLPYLYTQFYAANMLGMIWFMGNTTNVVVAMAFGIQPLDFSLVMAPPTLVMHLFAFASAAYYFRHDLPDTMDAITTDPRHVLRDGAGGMFVGLIVFICIVLLFVSSFVNVPIWLITVTAAGITLARDILVDFVTRREYRAASVLMDEMVEGGGHAAATAAGHSDDDQDAARDANPVVTSSSALTLPEPLPPPPFDAHDSVPAPASGKGWLDRTPHAAGASTSTWDSDVAAVVAAAAPVSSTKEAPWDSLAAPSLYARHHHLHLVGSSSDVDLVRARTASGAGDRLPSFLAAADGRGAAVPSAAASPVLATDGKQSTSSDIPLPPSIPPSAPGAVVTGTSAPPPPTAVRHAAYRALVRARRRFPHVAECLERVPYSVLPFLLGQFILVEALDATQVVPYLAVAASTLCAIHPVVTALLVALVACMLCAVMSNLPMTILMTKVLLSSAFRARVTGSAHRAAAMYAVVVASNVATCLALPGCLAGLMWAAMLGAKGVAMRPAAFAKVGMVVLAVPVLVGVAGLGGMVVVTTKEA